LASKPPAAPKQRDGQRFFGKQGAGKHIHKFFVDIKHFNKGQLRVCWTCNGQSMRPVIPIDAATKEVVLDILNDKFNPRLYEILSPEGQKVIYRLITDCKLNIDIHSPAVENLYTEFEIARGELYSGNDNPEIRAKLKKYTLELIGIGRISKSRGFEILMALSLYSASPTDGAFD
jgi:hypothetical protein